jgi:hypothetical protein
MMAVVSVRIFPSVIETILPVVRNRPISLNFRLKVLPVGSSRPKNSQPEQATMSRQINHDWRPTFLQK